METYQEFLNRIDSFETKKIDFGNQYFAGNPSISQKVDKENTFKKFYGDTVVFALSDEVKEKLAVYVEVLYRAAPECFCERLAAQTFHVTLHDLSSAPELRNVAEASFENELRVIEKIKEVQKQGKAGIEMKSKSLFNMVDTSLVLGLYPVDEDGYRRLMELYSIFEDVRKLNYPFTPHITLAYYHINGFGIQDARRLEDAVSRLNENEMEWRLELRADQLYYQKFRGMNDYIDIIPLISAAEK